MRRAFKLIRSMYRDAKIQTTKLQEVADESFSELVMPKSPQETDTYCFSTMTANGTSLNLIGTLWEESSDEEEDCCSRACACSVTLLGFTKWQLDTSCSSSLSDETIAPSGARSFSSYEAGDAPGARQRSRAMPVFSSRRSLARCHADDVGKSNLALRQSSK
eukprot:TRINITY_DN14763_c4_g1_i1.p1 TRINITY_DN14763_c4_g1~~TRINITY_DN14763_c4_g1_i1.p1  ORF type:complete len:162 (-),score=19.06 TRINITY_DN14763_c4_g1_i1:304-789(-)